MWLPSQLLNLFTLSIEDRADLAKLRLERDLLTRDLAEAKANFKWSVIRINSLELERAVLLEKVYNVKIAAPEIYQAPAQRIADVSAIFEHIDEDDPRSTISLPKWGN